MQFRHLLQDRRLLLAARLALLVALPFLLGMYILPHAQYVSGSLLSTPDENKNATDVLSYSFSADSHDNVLSQSVGSIFPLSGYLDFPPLVSHDRLQLCFQDNGSVIHLPNGTQIAPDLEWAIHINNDPPIRINTTTFACADVPKSGPMVYAWTAKINTGIDRESLNGTIIFDPATLTYPRVEMNYGLLQGMVLVPVFYLLIWYPLVGIWKKLHEGMMAQ